MIIDVVVAAMYKTSIWIKDCLFILLEQTRKWSHL